MSALPSASPLGSLAYPLDGGQPLPASVREGDRCRRELHIPPPDVLKIDAEGFEPQVIAGLAETIRQKRPVIFFEHTKLDDDQLRACVPPGYKLQRGLRWQESLRWPSSSDNRCPRHLTCDVRDSWRFEVATVRHGLRFGPDRDAGRDAASRAG